MTCEHTRFFTKCGVHRLTDIEGGPVTGYLAEIQIECEECKLSFRFLGSQYGTHYAEPRLSADGLQLRAPLEPAYTPSICGRPLESGTA